MKQMTAAIRDRIELEKREAAYRAGFLARTRGEPRHTKHDEGGMQYSAWIAGWDVADRTARKRGEEALPAVPLTAPHGVRKMKHKEQLPLLEVA